VECKVCGQDNPHEAHFCGNCGAALVVSAEPPGLTVVPTYPVAPPAVAEKYADFWIRFGAAIIDATVVWLISLVLSFLIRVIPFLPHWWLSVLVTPVPVGLLYYWLFIGLRGQTPGKMAFSIKVVNYQGDRPGLADAALREILGKLISTIVLFIGFLWIAFDDNKQGWHDKIASTYVVKVESRR